MPDSSDASWDGIDQRKPSLARKNDGRRAAISQGMGKICWRGGYRLRSAVSVQAEEVVKMQAERADEGGRRSEECGKEGQGNVWDWSAMGDMDSSSLVILGRVRDPTPAKMYPGAM